MQPVSEALIYDLYLQEPETPITLLTLDAPSMVEPIRVCDAPEGFTSDGVAYIYFPFNFSFGGASREEPSRTARVEIGNSDARIIEAARTMTGEPTMSMALVRPSAPDTVEIAMEAARLADIGWDDVSIVGTLKPRDFGDEPACKASYVIARNPGLFK